MIPPSTDQPPFCTLLGYSIYSRMQLVEQIKYTEHESYKWRLIAFLIGGSSIFLLAIFACIIISLTK